MDSLVGYGSDDDIETERSHSHHHSGAGGVSGAPKRREDDDNYDAVNMDMSEDSQAESEPELPQAEPSRHSKEHRRGSDDHSDRDRKERDRLRDSPARREKRSPRRDDKHRSERTERRGEKEGSSRRGLLGHRPDERAQDGKVPALMDLKPFGSEPPPSISKTHSQDARDAVSPRFIERRDREDRDRRDKDRRGKSREYERDRERHGRRSEEKRSGSRHDEHRSRSRGCGAAYPPPSSSSRGSPPTAEYRPTTSYKVNKKLEVMEKMGLQIKTPDGTMATAQQLRAAAAPTASYCNPAATKILDQVQKRKLLWSGKNKSEATEAAKWSGTRFAGDDGKQASKFMRLMGIKEPAAVKPEATDKTADPIKKQEELFQAMQAQYEVARATTHTMRGVGLGFQRGQF